MSWVKQAIDAVKAQPYEELHPTAFGGSAEKPDIFWALDPNDIPPPVKEAVETVVREQTLKSSLTCAIIRLETLGGYYSQDNSGSTGKDIGQFAIYLGTSPANTELKTHLSTDLGNPPESQPKLPPTSSRSSSKDPSSAHRTKAAGDVDVDATQQGGTRTPSMGEIEEEYGRVEEQSKGSGKRLSRITANLENWMRSK